MMPQINTPSIEDTGRFYTNYTGSINETSQTFTFTDTQNGMTFRNKGKSIVILTVDGEVYRVPPQATIEIDDNAFLSFDARIQTGTQDFEITAFREKSNVSGLGSLQSQVSNLTTLLAQTATKDEISQMATKSYVTEQIVNVNTGGTVDISAKADKSYVDKVAEMSIKQKLVNIVTNGDFSNGTTGWTLSNLTNTLENQILKATASASSGRVQKAIPYNTGDIIYRTALVKATSNLVALGAAGSAKKYHSGSGLFERLSHRGIDNSNKFISIVDTRTSGWDQFEVYSLLAINLTSIFGVGKEPTLEEMDSLLQHYYGGWFDGTVDLINKTIDDVKQSITNVSSTVQVVNNEVSKIKQFNPSAAVALTFDDGFKNNFTVAHPLLKERGLPATLFACSDWVLNSDGSAGWCSPADLLQMQDEGWEIGAHSKTHPNHTNLTDEQVHQEASLSKSALEAVGFKIDSYALPYGALPNNPNILPQYFTQVAQSGNAINKLPFPRYIYRYFPTNAGDGSPVDKVMGWIADAEKRGGVVVLGFHRIDEDISDMAWSQAKFIELLDRLDASKVFTFRDLAKAKALPHVQKLNKKHYRWARADSGTTSGSLIFNVSKGYGWDYNDRSFGVDLLKSKKLNSIRIKQVDNVEPLINNDTLDIWYSNDNATFTKHVGGFELYHYVDSKLEDVYRSILIKFINPPQARYWKFHQTLNHTLNKTKVDTTNVFADVWIEQNSINLS